MNEIRKFPDIQSYFRFLRGKSNEIIPEEVKKPAKKAKKAVEKADEEVKKPKKKAKKKKAEDEK